eukprot:scaffold1302_cov245-Pinguiococcus_pyrenoidosus.AAC.9
MDRLSHVQAAEVDLEGRKGRALKHMHLGETVWRHRDCVLETLSWTALPTSQETGRRCEGRVGGTSTWSCVEASIQRNSTQKCLQEGSPDRLYSTNGPKQLTPLVAAVADKPNVRSATRASCVKLGHGRAKRAHKDRSPERRGSWATT